MIATFFIGVGVGFICYPIIVKGVQWIVGKIK